MGSIIDYLFSSAAFVPHGYCLMWRPDLVAMHAVSDALIALSYFSIPGAIYLFVKRREDFEFRGAAFLFVAFIGLCGLTHVAGLVTLWQPYYGAQGMVKMATAGVSILTAFALWPMLPKLLAVPSPMQLRDVNRRLEDEVARHTRTEEQLIQARDRLEDRVRERTRELEDALAAQQRAESQLAHHAAELERSNRELDDFAHIASHDLKEPIRGIANSAHFYLEDFGAQLDEQARKQIGTIIRLAQRMDTFLNDLLKYSRYGHTKLGFRHVDTGAMVGDIMDDLRSTNVDHNAEITVQPDMPVLYCDLTRIREVFRNLISNALKYNESPLKSVELGVLPHQPGDAETTFFVKDNGIGIPAEFGERIFAMFKRLHGRDAYGGGSGAGLAIVKRVIEQHGGRIWCEPAAGGGTVFWFTIGPAEEQEAHNA
jgi:signal transduction histidine kinase